MLKMQSTPLPLPLVSDPTETRLNKFADAVKLENDLRAIGASFRTQIIKIRKKPPVYVVHLL